MEEKSSLSYRWITLCVCVCVLSGTVTFWVKTQPPPVASLTSDRWDLTNWLHGCGWWISERSNQDISKIERTALLFLLTEVLDGVIALLVVHLDGLSVRAADAVPDGVTAHHDVLVLRRRPAHHDAVDQRAHVERAGLVRHTGLWGGRGRKMLKQAVDRRLWSAWLQKAFFTVQVALKRLCRGPLGGRARPVHRYGRHPEGVLGAALQTCAGDKQHKQETVKAELSVWLPFLKQVLQWVSHRIDVYRVQNPQGWCSKL